MLANWFVTLPWKVGTPPPSKKSSLSDCTIGAGICDLEVIDALTLTLFKGPEDMDDGEGN
jgi:hypothetical protein